MPVHGRKKGFAPPEPKPKKGTLLLHLKKEIRGEREGTFLYLFLR